MGDSPMSSTSTSSGTDLVDALAPKLGCGGHTGARPATSVTSLAYVIPVSALPLTRSSNAYFSAVHSVSQRSARSALKSMLLQAHPHTPVFFILRVVVLDKLPMQEALRLNLPGVQLVERALLLLFTRRDSANYYSSFVSLAFSVGVVDTALTNY